MILTKRPRANRSQNSAKQLAALRQIPKPADAPADAKGVPVTVNMYPEALANLEELVAGAEGASRSMVVRKALAFAIAHKEEFLKEFGVELG